MDTNYMLRTRYPYIAETCNKSYVEIHKPYVADI